MYKIDRLKILALILFFITTLISTVSAQEGLSWFKLAESTATDWNLIFNEADPLRFRLLQKNPINDETPKQILLLFPKRSSAYNTAIERITALFRANNLNVEFTAINFEGNPTKGTEVLREIMTQNYDLVFSVGSTSTKYVTQNIAAIDVPVVSVTSKDPVLLGQVADYTSGSGTNLAYTSLDIPIEVQIAYLKELRPNLQNIGVMYARNNVSAYEAQVVPLIDAVSDSIRIIEIVVENQDNAANELMDKMPLTIDTMRESDPRLENSIFWVTGSTSVFREIATINAHAQSIPVLSVVSDVVREGEESAAISIGISFRSNADLATFYALDILKNNVQPSTLPVGIVSPPDIAVNFLVARKIGLKVPFSFFESSATIYGVNGKIKRINGETVLNR